MNKLMIAVTGMFALAVVGVQTPAFAADEDPATVITRTTKTLQYNPKDATALAQRALAYRQQGEFDQALADYERLMKVNPSAESYYKRAEVYMALGDRGDAAQYKLAAADYDVIISRDSKAAYAYYFRGESYRKSGDYVQAIKDFDQAIANNPTNVWFFASRADAFDANGDYQKALDSWQQAIELGFTEADLKPKMDAARAKL